MVDVLEQIDALMRHVRENTNVEEARTAAYAVARLIVKHNIQLVLPPAGWGTSFPAPKPARPPRSSSSTMDGFYDMMSRIQKARAQQEAEEQKPKPKTAPPEVVDDGWRPMKAKFSGYCKWCGKPIKANTPIYWSKDHGAYHPVCYLKSL